ncbi:hypothetical protein COHA_009597 [Chlorella ohadii]|uniref:HotDog ACOT-type domain-containing protein n=1 Tax=Chlorella ohadii TaxID=2649997 RepID=A0AAD5DF77_9CHLO|nr:hypothetical protein COHA_009597 [Chlorella ohadii]
MEKLLAAPPRDPAAQLPKPPRPISITYPFSTDEMLREHYRSPWEEVRIGRILEDLDSLAGYVAFDHSEMEGETTRPPLCVTASVETIELYSSSLNLRQDMKLTGRVVWTGSSSMDIQIDLEQAGQRQLTALFTFVARDVLTNKSHPITPLAPRTKPDQERFCERQRAAQQRRAARQAAAGGGGQLHRALHSLRPEAERWAEQLLATAKNKQDLPALVAPHTLLMSEASHSNVFVCQPQNRNVHGRVFGGFLMRRAFELAHATTYLFAGCRPLAVEVEEVTFKRPVNVGDLIKFRSQVLHTWVSPDQPDQGMAYVQVQASVTQPEKRQSVTTNTFDFIFKYALETDEHGAPLPPKMILPSTEQQALEVARVFGPGSEREQQHNPALARLLELEAARC